MKHSLTRLRKVLIGILCLSMVFCTSFVVGTAAKPTLGELASQKASIQKELDAIKNEKDAAEKEAELTKEKINIVQQQINEYESKIAILEKQIAEKEELIRRRNQELADAKELFKQRLRAIYMSGGTSGGLQILLGAEDFSDYLAKYELTKTVSAHDSALMERIAAMIEEIEAAKAAIESSRDDLEGTRKELAASRAELNTTLRKQNSNIASLGEQKESLEEDLEDVEAAYQEAERAMANAGGIHNGKYDGGAFLWPVPGYYNITSYYGQRWGRLHKGIDISSYGIYGKPIVAAADGTVSVAGWNGGGYGYYVVIDHGTDAAGRRFSTLYGHQCQQPIVSARQHVSRGQVIGYVGNTGDSYGAHLHFEIRINNVATDPMLYFR